MAQLKETMDLLREINNRQTKFSCIKRKARDNSKEVFTSLAHHLSPEYLVTSLRKLRKSAASGVDEVNAHDYELNLSERIEDLNIRLKEGRYRAPNIRRASINKGNGQQRPLGISTTEDKIVQRAVTDILNLIYEQDFYDFSYGSRINRSAHQALVHLRQQCMRRRIKWLYDAGIQSCFDNFDHTILLSLLRKRISDNSILQLIQQWLKVGVVDDDSLQVSKSGTPQGNIISPLLCNVYLHYVLDQWLHETVRPLLKGEIFLLRYADDFVTGFEYQEDALRVTKTLPKRMEKYGLTIHPEKSKLINFTPEVEGKLPTFDFLGFTHYWAKSQRGNWVVKRKARLKKMQVIVKNLRDTCKRHKHEKLRDQSKRLKSKLRGLYQYFGIRGNFIAIRRMYEITICAWFKWLNRRSQRKSYTWKGYGEVLKYFQLPKPRIVHHNG
jgi:group II intron reverse transcriptase/maturase